MYFLKTLSNLQHVNPLQAASKKILTAVLCVVMICAFSDQPEKLADAEHMRMPWYTWFPLFFFIAFVQRLQYYYAWGLGKEHGDTKDLYHVITIQYVHTIFLLINLNLKFCLRI